MKLSYERSMHALLPVAMQEAGGALRRCFGWVPGSDC